MAQWAWKLVVTGLGTQDGALEAVVSADNWLSALRAGRKELGEDGGVPQGASCVMSATGDVTILDAARRRRYVLVRAVPAEAIAAGSEPEVMEVAALSSEVPETARLAPASGRDAEPLAALPVAPAVEPPSLDSSSREPHPIAEPTPAAAALSHTPNLAAQAEAIDQGNPAKAGGAAEEKAAPKNEGHALAATAEAVQDRVPEAPQTANEPLAEERSSAAGEIQPDGQRSLPRATQTLAYSAMRAQALEREFEVSRSLSAANPPVNSGAEAAGALPLPSLHTLAPQPRAMGTTNSIPPPPKLTDDVHIRQPSDRVRPRRSMPSAPRLDGLTLLARRDADPSPQSPLTYRERSYLVARSADRERLEALLQAKFAMLRQELAGKPRGQLVHLAVFDHSFDERPLRPPIATLEWRDWRGNALFMMAGDAAGAEPATAAVAPRAPEAGWPAQLRPSAVPAALASSPATATRSEPPPRAGVAKPASPAGITAPARTSSAPPPAPSTSSWPVPPQTPLEPARVLSAAWPIAPQPSTDPTGPASDLRASTRPSAADVLPAAPAPSRGQALDPSAPLPLPHETAAPWAPAKQHALLSDAFRPSAAGPQASDSFGPFDAQRDPTGETDSRLATAFEAMSDLYFLPTPVAGLEFTIQMLKRLVPSEAVSGCLYDINMDVFRFVVLTGPGAIERRAGSVASQAGLFGAAKRSTNEALVVTDVAADGRFDAQVDGRDGLEVKAVAYLPVRHGGQLLGMMQLINRENAPGYSLSDVAVLTYVTAQLAEFLATRRNLG